MTRDELLAQSRRCRKMLSAQMELLERLEAQVGFPCDPTPDSRRAGEVLKDEIEAILKAFGHE